MTKKEKQEKLISLLNDGVLEKDADTIVAEIMGDEMQTSEEFFKEQEK